MAELKAAEAAHDPLAVHIYQARAAYRKTQAGDKSKAARRTGLALWTSYQQAAELGFTASRDVWEMLMKCGWPDAARWQPSPPFAANGTDPLAD